MSFRDDHEAALARVGALEEEIERWKAELEQRTADYELVKRDNERLQAENDDLRKRVPKPPKPKPKRPREPSGTPSERMQKLKKSAPKIGVGALTVGLFALVVVGPICTERENEREYQAALADYERQKATWHALIRFEDCARDTLGDIELVKPLDAAKVDPRQTGGHYSVRVINPCAKDLIALREIPHLVAVKGLLDDWRAAQVALSGPNAQLAAYYSNRDWKDDGYAAAPKLWADFKPALLRYETATRTALRTASPLARSEIRAIQRKHEDKHGKDTAWWRIEIGFARNELASVLVLGGTPDEMFAKAKELRQLIASAPLELRRELRQLVDELDYLDRGHKAPHELSDYQLWRRTTDEGIGPIPKRPVKAEGCGDGGAV